MGRVEAVFQRLICEGIHCPVHTTKLNFVTNLSWKALRQEYVWEHVKIDKRVQVVVPEYGLITVEVEMIAVGSFPVVDIFPMASHPSTTIGGVNDAVSIWLAPVFKLVDGLSGATSGCVRNVGGKAMGPFK